MPDLTTPTSRAERRAAVAAWRAVPVRQRFAVVRSAKNGVRHPDPDAAAAAESYARVVLRPRGRSWWQRSRPRVTTAVLLVGALVLAGLGALLFRLEGGGSTGGRLVVGFALVELALAWLLWDTARDCRLILSVAPAEDGVDAPAGQLPRPSS